MLKETKKETSRQFFYNQIQKILFHDWNPLDLQTLREKHNEYTSYISTVYQLMTSEQSESELFDHLWWVETDQMELTGNTEHTKNVTHNLLKLAKWSCC